MEFDLAAGEGGTFDIVAVRAVEGAMPMKKVEAAPTHSDPTPPMMVSGTINKIDTTEGVANVTHGPIKEIGMPGMTMDFPLGKGITAADLPVGTETTLRITMDPETFEMRLIGADGAATQ